MAFTYPWPKRVLMVTPDAFRVDHALNPYMRDADGRLQNIDQARARQQWTKVQSVFESLGVSVDILVGRDDLPDMVFCANSFLSIIDRAERAQVLLSRMKNACRQPEVPIIEEWAKNHGLKTYMMTDFAFEGGGDAVWNYEKREIWGGYGFRSDKAAYDIVERHTGVRVHRVELIDEYFYHLDTALAILDADTCAYVPEAFSEDGRALLRARFARPIAIDTHEARHHFAANCVSVDGRHVLLHKGSPRFCADLRRAGFEPIEIDVSEFLKSGGSIFCIKQQLF